MANDVGIRIGVDGEKEFKTAISGINSQIKNLNSEMKAAVSELAGFGDAEDLAAKKTDILGRQLEANKQKASILSDEYKRAKETLAKLESELNSVTNAQEKDEAAIARATNAYNKQSKKVNDLGTQLNNTTADINRIEREMRDVTSEALDMGEAFEDAGKSAGGFSDALSAGFAGGAISGGIQVMVDSIRNLVDETTEYRKIMGTLRTSSEQAGYTAEQTAESFEQLYGIIGDEQQTATALANLQAIGLSQDRLKQITEGAIGAWTTYGDSIPIDSLSEAILETIMVGKSVGAFSDMLSWAGTNEDDFNAKLAATASEAERVDLVLQEMAKQGLMQSAEAWRLNNQEMVNSANAQLEMRNALADLATTLSPAVTTVTLALAGFVGKLNDLHEAGAPVVPVITGLVAGMTAFKGAMAVTAGISALVSGIRTWTAATQGMTVAQKALNLAMKANVIGIVVAGVAALVTGLVTAYKTSETFRAKVDAAFAVVKNTVKNAMDTAERAVQTAEKAIISAVTTIRNIPSKMKSIGSDIVKGIWNGITNGKDWLVGKIKGFASNVVSSFKDGFKIHSPSKIMEDEVGLPLPQGIAVGITKGMKYVKTAVKKLVTSTTSGAFDSKKIGNIGGFISSAIAQGLLANKSTAVKAAEEVVSAVRQEMTEKLAEMNKTLEEMNKDSTGKYTEAAKQAMQEQINSVQKFADEYANAADAIMASQDSMTQKLRDYGELIKTVTFEDYEYRSLASLQTQIDMINRYGEALEALKAKGAPESLLDEITEMSIEDAVEYSNMLLNLTDTQYEDYVKLWEEKQKLAADVARKFYSSELEALNKEFGDKLPKELSHLKNDMYGVGTNSVQGMIDGMNAKLPSLRAAASRLAAEALAAMKSTLDINSPSRRIRKEVGYQSGEGFILGFEDSLMSAASRMSAAIMAPIQRLRASDMYNAAAATVNGMAAVGGAYSQTIVIPVNLNGQTIAEVVYDPLKNVSKQRGDDLG